VAGGLLSAFLPRDVEVDDCGCCGSLDDTGLVGELGDCWSLSWPGNLTEGIMERATALTCRSASWTRSSTWLSEGRERSGLPVRVVSSDIFYQSLSINLVLSIMD
jgi:hypothetical protein